MVSRLGYVWCIFGEHYCTFVRNTIDGYGTVCHCLPASELQALISHLASGIDYILSYPFGSWLSEGSRSEKGSSRLGKDENPNR